MNENVFFGLAALLWVACMIYAVWGGYHRRWWALFLAPLAFVAGFFALMLALAQFAQNAAPGDLAWLGFAPYFALPFLPPIPLAFGLGRIALALRNRFGQPS